MLVVLSLSYTYELSINISILYLELLLSRREPLTAAEARDRAGCGFVDHTLADQFENGVDDGDDVVIGDVGLLQLPKACDKCVRVWSTVGARSEVVFFDVLFSQVVEFVLQHVDFLQRLIQTLAKPFLLRLKQVVVCLQGSYFCA